MKILKTNINSKIDDLSMIGLSETAIKNLAYPSLTNDELFAENIEFLHLSAADKKPVSYTFSLKLDSKDLIVSKRTHDVTTYRDPQTQLIVTDLSTRDREIKSKKPVARKFREMIYRYIYDAWKIQYNILKTKYDDDPEKYAETYKPLDLINMQITRLMRSDVYLAKQILNSTRYFAENSIGNINDRLAYSDTWATEYDYFTTRLDYENPANKKITKNDQKLVNDFLSVFMDDENIRVCLWYFGMLLSNVETKDISKMLIVSSAKGGNGKNTLIESLLFGLMNGFYSIKDSLDVYFNNDNRFATSRLMPLHATMFGEAEFNSKFGEAHDFTGYDIDRFKTLISDGIYTSEEKFKNSEINIAPNSFFITRTNNFPDISSDRQALNRRLLPLVLKSSSMAEKGKQLGLTTRKAIFDYIYNNRQTFANVFYDFYQKNKKLYLNYEYDKVSEVNKIQKLNQTYESDMHNANEQFNKLKQQDAINALHTLSKLENLNFDKLFEIINANQSEKYKNIFRIKNDKSNHNILYLNSSAKVITAITGDTNARKVLIKYYGKPIKKFCQRMLVLGNID